MTINPIKPAREAILDIPLELLLAWLKGRPPHVRLEFDGMRYEVCPEDLRIVRIAEPPKAEKPDYVPPPRCISLTVESVLFDEVGPQTNRPRWRVVIVNQPVPRIPQPES